MTAEMDDYDKHRAELEAANLPVLHGFHQYLIDRKTGKKAACDHVDRMTFFANEFLLNYANAPLSEGYDQISSFLGDWFIRKAMWSDAGSLEENIGTFRKFYDYLLAIGHMDEARFKELASEIEGGAPVWRRHLRRYNDPHVDLEDVWDYGEDEDPGSQPADGKARDHLVLMLSGIAAKHFKIRMPRLPKVDDLAAADHWSSCWRCDLLGSNEDTDTFYFLLTNARTLYSLVVPVTERRIESLIASFAQILHHQYQLAGVNLPATPGGTYLLVKGQPRSLIGSQNELLRCALELFNRPDPSLDGLCRDLNQTPMFALPEIIPAEAFAKAIASDPPFAPAPGGNIVRFPGPTSN